MTGVFSDIAPGRYKIRRGWLTVYVQVVRDPAREGLLVCFGETGPEDGIRLEDVRGIASWERL